ncbi:MAG: hypothetical protein EOP49_47680, partial [Sphingobacteriales bacterium]
MEDNRVVITGMGVCAPNGTVLDQFRFALENGLSGISHRPELERLGFSCQIAGVPAIDEQRTGQYFSPFEIRNLDSSGIVYGVVAALDAWRDAGLVPSGADAPDWDSGTFFGTGTSGTDKFRWAINKIDAHEIRKLGSSVVAQTMASGVSAYISGKLGLGNRVSTNSSACATGTESILMAYEHLKSGKAKRPNATTSDYVTEHLYNGVHREVSWKPPGLIPIEEKRRSKVCKLEMMRAVGRLEEALRP